MNLATLGRNWVLVLFVLLALYPFLPVAESNRGEQFTILFIYAILALGLNVVIGYTGLLHLGIAAFFGILMNANYLLAGAVSSNPVLIILGTFVMLAWRNAGWIGLDRWLLPALAD